MSLCVLLFLVTFLCSSTGEALAATRAGEVIRNIAKAEAVVGSVNEGVVSNQVDIIVDELLDLKLNSARDNLTFDAKGVVTAPFLLTNQGNGDEAFNVTLTPSTSGITVVALALDADDDGVFTAGSDPLLTNGATPPVAPGDAITILTVLAGQDVRSAESLSVTAQAITKYGQPGTIAAGAGDRGSDAIVGLTGAEATLKLPLLAAKQTNTLHAAVTKTQAVRAPDGSDRPVRGAVITYTLEATFTGTGIAQAAQLIDPVPPGTVYRPDSLRLDGAPLTDAADGDAGAVQGPEIRVALGSVAAPSVHQLSFDVIIQ